MLTNVPGCEVREDDLVVKMFQVVDSGCDGTKGRVALPPKSLLATMQAADGWHQDNSPTSPLCVLSKYVLLSDFFFFFQSEKNKDGINRPILTMKGNVYWFCRKIL